MNAFVVVVLFVWCLFLSYVCACVFVYANRHTHLLTHTLTTIHTNIHSHILLGFLCKYVRMYVYWYVGLSVSAYVTHPCTFMHSNIRTYTKMYSTEIFMLLSLRYLCECVLWYVCMCLWVCVKECIPSVLIRPELLFPGFGWVLFAIIG